MESASLFFFVFPWKKNLLLKNFPMLCPPFRGWSTPREIRDCNRIKSKETIKGESRKYSVEVHVTCQKFKSWLLQQRSLAFLIHSTSAALHPSQQNLSHFNAHTLIVYIFMKEKNIRSIFVRSWSLQCLPRKFFFYFLLAFLTCSCTEKDFFIVPSTHISSEGEETLTKWFRVNFFCCFTLENFIVKLQENFQ